MTGQSPRSYTKLAIAVVLAAMIIGSVLYLGISSGSKTVTVTITTPITFTSTVTDNSTITTILNASCSSSPNLHCVAFQQLGACNPEFWGVPWSVTVDGVTQVQPEGSSVPGPNSGLGGTTNQNLTIIVFSLPDGAYNFSVRPSNGYFTPTSGTVDVNGTDVLVQIAYTGTGCTETRTVSGTSVDSSDTYLTSCSISGAGALQLRVVSELTGGPVSGEMINAVDILGCNEETQVVYLDNFTVGPDGWLTPVFPDQAAPAGKLSFTVTYEGETYNFSTVIPPMGTSCVTLQVPSGNVTSSAVANGEGSYCWQ
jgi:hypothetical protein